MMLSSWHLKYLTTLQCHNVVKLYLEWNTRTRLHQRRSALVQDGCGYRWCEQCQAQRDLMNWGALHHFPALHAGMDTLEQGREAWLRFCQMEGLLAVQQLLALAACSAETRDAPAKHGYGWFAPTAGHPR